MPAADLAAQGQPLPLLHPAEPPLEHYTPRVLVGSDGIVVGLEAIGSPGDLQADRLVAYLPGPGRDSLCVSIRSIDGKYRGSFHFAASGARSGATLLDVRSRRYARELAAYTPDRLAVEAYLGASCASPPETFVLVGRNATARPGTLRVSLNADAGLLVRAELQSPSHELPSTRCPLLEVEDAHAFNRVCILPLPPAGRYDLQLTLRIPGQESQFARYAVRLP